MRSSVLKRLDDLDKAATIRSRPPLVLIDVTKLGDDDRDAYWAGDDDVLTAHGAVWSDVPDVITTIVVSLNVANRDRWLATKDMEDDELEAEVEGRSREEEAAERATQRQTMLDEIVAIHRANLPPGVWGYDASGYPIYDGDPRAVGVWKPG